MKKKHKKFLRESCKRFLGNLEFLKEFQKEGGFSEEASKGIPEGVPEKNRKKFLEKYRNRFMEELQREFPEEFQRVFWEGTRKQFFKIQGFFKNSFGGSFKIYMLGSSLFMNFRDSSEKFLRFVFRNYF